MSEKTFISVSVGLAVTILSFVFASGIAYQRLGNVEKEVAALRSDFNKYVIEKHLAND